MTIRTQKQALAAAVKRWGKNAAVRSEPRFASTPEARQAARDKRQALLAKLRPTGGREKWAKADREELDRLLFEQGRHQFTVGRIAMGMFFEVKGEGDTWADAFYAADYAEAKDHDDFLNRHSKPKKAA